MTKTKAIKLMLENSRAVVDPAFASTIAKAFGYTLSQLEIKAMKNSQHHRLNYANPNLKSVAIYWLAKKLAEKEKSITISSGMHGSGSYAQDITEKSCAVLTA